MLVVLVVLVVTLCVFERASLRRVQSVAAPRPLRVAVGSNGSRRRPAGIFAGNRFDTEYIYYYIGERPVFFLYFEC